MDVAAFVDTVALEPEFPARCVFVAGQRLPMSAVYVAGRPAGDRSIEGPADLLRARYGGEAGSTFVRDHEALLRRLGTPGPDLHVPMSYDDLFGALAVGRIDVAPDYAGIATTYARALRAPGQVGILRYRDCGVLAYGTAFFATDEALAERRDEVAAFLDVIRDHLEWMRESPEDVVEASRPAMPDVDREHALREWREEEQEVVFGFGPPGHSDPAIWEETIQWRREVAGFDAPPDPSRMFAPLATAFG